MKKLLRKHAWILPASLGLGLCLSLLDGGTFWTGWLAYTAVLITGLAILSGLWHSCGSPRRLGFLLLLTVILRLGLGMAFSYILPAYGNDNEVHNAGYVFRDSYTRDTQAWALASSSESLWTAFDNSSYSDQYGGMLFLGGALYRFLSPDAQRPWLIILAGALTSALGVGLAWKAARKAWGESFGWGIAWITALYPEAILLGSAQMREPFLVTFVGMTFWGVANWQENWRTSAAWLAGGMAGMLLFNPAIAVAAVILLAVWALLRKKERRPVRWWWFAAGSGVVFLSVYLFSWAVRDSVPTQGGMLATILNWLRYSMQWDAYLLELHSGWIQNVFDALPDQLHLPFTIGLGIAQPVLPAAIADPAVWPMRILNTWRALGWYALIPFLAYSLRPILRTEEKPERLAWLWLWLVTWGWIMLSAARAGGDPWDNPRYRVIFLLFQAALAIKALGWQHATHDRWLGRLLAVEGVFLSLFGYWYIARYTDWRAGQVHVFVIMLLIILISSVILAGGWITDRQRAKRA